MKLSSEPIAKACKWSGKGRPLQERWHLLKAFIAKSIYDLPTTKVLLENLKTSPSLRRLCGWEYPGQIPSEATFSRAFKSGVIGAVSKTVRGNMNIGRAISYILPPATAGFRCLRFLTSASPHDSQAAISLMQKTEAVVGRIFYDLADSAYDAPEINAFFQSLEHVLMIVPNKRRKAAFAHGQWSNGPIRRSRIITADAISGSKAQPKFSVI